jgi:hypothetical protein
VKVNAEALREGLGKRFRRVFLRGQADRIVVQLMREKSGADEIHRA